MNLKDFSLLADENIHPRVIQSLRASGHSVTSLLEIGLKGAIDPEILKYSKAENRVILTHDSDLGMLAILAGAPVYGIIYLRPGSINPEFTTASLNALFAEELELEPPFIIVVDRRGESIKIRVRRIEQP